MSNKGTMLTLLFIVFLDMIGIGIIAPILPLVFFETPFLAGENYSGLREFLLGLLIAAYPLAQFFGAPILGALSDKHGRKKILFLSLLGTFFGYVLFAVGLAMSNIFLLFFSRFVDGFTGGNISVARSAIADISTPQTKVKNFGLMGMMFAFGFIIGPFIGGVLSDPKIVPWFDISTPFWFAALLSAFNILFLIWKFKETLKEKFHRPIGIFTGFRDIKKALTSGNLKAVFISVFLMIFGWSFFTQFFPVYLYDKFNFTSADIGILYAYSGFWIAISQGVIVRHISAKYGSNRVLAYSIIFTAATLLALLLPKDSFHLYLILPFVTAFFGFTMPNFSNILSNAVSQREQGEIMGIQQSMMSLAQVIPPLIAGISIAFDTGLPIVFASASVFLAWIVYTFLWSDRRNPKYI